MANDLLTTAQAADLIGIDRRTLTRWVDEGRATPDFTAPGYRGVMLWKPATAKRLAKDLAAQRKSANDPGTGSENQGGKRVGRPPAPSPLKNRRAGADGRS